MTNRKAGLAVAAIVAALLGSAARADTLAAALASAYETNPELQAQRAVVRQIDEQVPQALAGYRPTLGANVGLDQNGDSFNDSGRIFSAGGTITQPLYTGGSVRASVSASENRVLAARAQLRAVENNILINVVTAYADVLAQMREVELTTNQVRVLERELQASRDRFEVGDLTRTDVAQSEARLERARSLQIAAQGRLETARQSYRRVVGRLPVDLEPPPPLPTLPGTPGQAVDIAMENNPGIVAARFQEAAARYDVRAVEGARLPTVAAQAGLGFANYAGQGGTVPPGDYFTQNIGIAANVPLYQAGQIGSQIRQAQQVRSQRLEEISATTRAVVESTTNSYTNLQAARATIQSAESGVRANTLALEGVKQENAVGSRTVLDVLNAEQELLVSQVDLVRARRDEYVSGFALLANMGLVEAQPMGLAVTPYNPEVNAARVRKIWGDWNTPPNPAPLPTPPAGVATKSEANYPLTPQPGTAAPAPPPGIPGVAPQSFPATPK